ncbi:hypothetical protein [Saccharothrix sp. Mg75]|uniref:hypothetical protein n=1 Tax=Saccharothrix sp. Mg75 TaxID=3445357 RepID=UPI003EEEC05C
MTDPYGNNDDEDEASSASFDRSSSEDDSVPISSDSDDGTNSEEEPQFQEAARRIRAQKRKNSDDDSARQVKRAKKAAEEQEDEAAANTEAQSTLADTQGRGRVVIKPAATTVMTLVHLVPPAYTPFALTPANLHPGGQSVTCTLGPAAWRSTNSNAQSTTSLPCLVQIKAAHPLRTFYAGHLLNAQFGGPSTSTNITALTSGANTAQKAFDNHIVNALGHLQAVYTALNDVGVDVLLLGYGIQLTIVMSPVKWAGLSPNDCISTGMTCTALVVNPPNVDALVGAVYPTGQGLPAYWNITRQGILDGIQAVQDEVTTANLNSNINNT